jgi:four helix bundle protein
MIKSQSQKQYDLEERTLAFAKKVRSLVKELPQNTCNFEDGKQLVRSSGSVGANYIEANEAVSKKDFIFRIRLCRKEAKESSYWLKLVDTQGLDKLEWNRNFLISESVQLMKIFAAILNKSK